MTWEESQNRFIGSTNEKDCQSSLNGSTYATAEVELYEDRILFGTVGSTQMTSRFGALLLVPMFSIGKIRRHQCQCQCQYASETCADAMNLEVESQATPNSGTLYTHVLNGNFGVSTITIQLILVERHLVVLLFMTHLEMMSFTSSRCSRPNLAHEVQRALSSCWRNLRS